MPILKVRKINKEYNISELRILFSWWIKKNQIYTFFSVIVFIRVEFKNKKNNTFIKLIKLGILKFCFELMTYVKIKYLNKKTVSINHPSIFVAAVNWNIKTRLFNNTLNDLSFVTLVVLWRRQVMLYNNNDYFSQSNDAIQP